MKIRVKLGKNPYNNRFTCGRCREPFERGGFFVRLEYGGMSAVFTRTSATDTVLVIKGNKPLTLWYHKGFRAVFYSSEEWPLMRVIGEGREVVPLDVAPYTLSVFNVADLMDFRQCDLYFKGRMRSYSSWGYQDYLSTEL